MLADEGDYAAAWQLFREAQRADADNPSLAHLELVLLASEGKIEQVGERARFWAARLRKLGYEGEELVNFIDEVARNPEGFAQAMEEHGRGMADVEALERLAELAENLPPPDCHYRLRPRDDSAGPLEPDASLSEIEQDWQGRINFDDEDAWSETGWIDWLAAHPLAWQSFSVLEDVLMAVDEFPFEDEEDGRLLDEIEDALLDHSVKLLRQVIAENRADGLKLEWGWLENRAALGLLARRIEVQAGTDEELPLNPNDNHGLREQLAHVYASEGRPADALTVCDRYADDAMGSLLYGRVLALYLLDRRSEATAALATAKKLSPRILKTLTAARPQRPRGLQPGIITVDGEDEAWFYRQRWRGVWEATGAMAWLRQAAGVKG
jgi:tetratricopeptide (TPR) repeat protein